LRQVSTTQEAFKIFVDQELHILLSKGYLTDLAEYCDIGENHNPQSSSLVRISPQTSDKLVNYEVISTKTRKRTGPKGFGPSTCGSLHSLASEGSEDLALQQIFGDPDDATGPTSITSSFHTWLVSQGKTKATIKETVNYAKRFGHILDTGDASPMLTLSVRNKQHAMTALANLAKFQGRYDVFLQIRQRYSLKWSKGDSIQHFNRFFNDELTFDTMLERIREMVDKTHPR
jgi:hypothetical protein